jgi:hypothetical protein
VVFEGYAGVVGPDGVVTARNGAPQPAQGWARVPPTLQPPKEISFAVGSTLLYGLFIDDPDDPIQGYDTLVLTADKDSQTVKTKLKPGFGAGAWEDRWSNPIEVRLARSLATVAFRLFDLEPDASQFLLYFTRPMRELSSHPGLLPKLRKAAGTFMGNGAKDLYRQGAFGIPISRGGDGRAERRYLETVERSQTQRMAATRWVLENLPWDLVFTYSAFPDEAEHLWRGYLEPGLPEFRRDRAELLRPFLEAVYRSCDRFLGILMDLRPPNTVLALVSDHGVEGVSKRVRINTALRRAGLLVVDERGRPDPSKSKALYPATTNAYILINSTERREGIVKPEERAIVVEEIRKALGAVSDDGRKVITAVYDAEKEGTALGVGGAAGGDLYLDLLPGYDFDAQLGGSDVVIPREPEGAHGFDPKRASMRTILALNGPGVAAGQRLRDARTIDFAPTLAELLNIAPPSHSTGKILTEALSR